jgi:hypothetical protein
LDIKIKDFRSTSSIDGKNDLGVFGELPRNEVFYGIGGGVLRTSRIDSSGSPANEPLGLNAHPIVSCQQSLTAGDGESSIDDLNQCSDNGNTRIGILRLKSNRADFYGRTIQHDDTGNITPSCVVVATPDGGRKKKAKQSE